MIGRITTTGIITEYRVGYWPGRITAGPDSALWFSWFTGYNVASVGRITTEGIVTRFSYSGRYEDLPQAITAGPDGALWFTEAEGQKVGRISTAGIVTEHPISLPRSWYIQPFITTGPDGALWFTTPYTGLNTTAAVVRVTTAGFVTTFPFHVGSRPSLGYPVGITAGPDRALWFNDAGRIGRITTAGDVTMSPPVCPDPWRPGPTCPRSQITVGPDGALWFSTFSQAAGRITTAGIVSRFSLPFFPENIITGPDGNLWFTGYRCDQFCNRYLIAQIILSPPDTTKPISHVSPLPGAEALANFPVQWSGADTGAGVHDYTIFVSDNGSPFNLWLWQTGATRGVFPGAAGHVYGFYSIARDWAGNQESPKTAADANTQVAAMVPGDLNRDGHVDCTDLAIVKASFGKRIGQTGFDPRADVNVDGVVDVRDLAFVSQKLVPGTPCP